MSQGPLFLSCLLCLNLLHLRLKVDKKCLKLFETSHEQIFEGLFCFDDVDRYVPILCKKNLIEELKF